MDTNDREYGIDLLRIVSMLMILAVHILYHGGISENSRGIYDAVGDFIYSLIICGVDCFALISGYVGGGSGRKFRFSRIPARWAQVFFYSFGIHLIFRLSGSGYCETERLLYSALPITKNLYWYATSYFGLMLFMPLLDAALEKIEKKTLAAFLLLAAIFFSALPSLLNGDAYKLNGGYSVLWLMVLYLIGGFLKKTGLKERFSAGVLACAFLVIVCVDFVLMHYADVDLTYILPPVVLSAVILVLLFAKMDIRAPGACKIIRFVSAGTFGVYLFHDNTLIRKALITGFAERFLTYSVPGFVLAILASALVIFAAGLLVETLRVALFLACRIDSLIDCGTRWVEEKLQAIWNGLNPEEKAGTDNLPSAKS